MTFGWESIEQRLLREYFGKDKEKLADAKKRLEKHEPIAYILGETVFFREFYYVTPAVLIPRPDTERVVEKILRHLPENGKLLDLCTGSGCISVSALCNTKHTTSVAVDISKDALAVAEKNAERNGMFFRIRFLQGDIFSDALWEQLAGLGPFDVIAANPPYVSSSVIPYLENECAYEPKIAFDGGEDGMDFYREILRRSPYLLKKEGRIILEIGYDQRKGICGLAEKQRLSCKITKDYGGNDRVAVLRLSEERSRELFGPVIDTMRPFQNPIAGGCFAEPDARFFDGKAYIYTVRSLPLSERKFIDCFVSEDLRSFEKIENCFRVDRFSAPDLGAPVGGPTVVEKDGRYYCAVSFGNFEGDEVPGGIEIAVSDSPAGPFRRYLKSPLLSRFVYGTKPCDPYLFKDDDGRIYLLFSGYDKLFLARMDQDMTGFIPSKQRKTFIPITPPFYQASPCMIKRKGHYYLFWRAGYCGMDYQIKYSISKSIFGPYEQTCDLVCLCPEDQGTPGHFGILTLPDGRTVLVYHRKENHDIYAHRTRLCLNTLEFDKNGKLPPVNMR